MAGVHLVRRAYIWGFADTVHAGLEGHAFQQLAFGHLYYAKAPWYFSPGVIVVKLLLGLILLDLRGRLARNLYSLGILRAYAEKPDLEAAERLLRESAAADPSAFFVHIELGNIYVKQGSRDAASQAYESALEHAPNDLIVRLSIQDQIRLLSIQPVDQMPPLRNPALE